MNINVLHTKNVSAPFQNLLLCFRHTDNNRACLNQLLRQLSGLEFLYAYAYILKRGFAVCAYSALGFRIYPARDAISRACDIIIKNYITQYKDGKEIK